MSTIDVLRLLARELGATPIDPTRYCPICWTPTVPTRRGDTVHAPLPALHTPRTREDRMTRRNGDLAICRGGPRDGWVYYQGDLEQQTPRG
jgi:hypothetical protein